MTSATPSHRLRFFGVWSVGADAEGRGAIEGLDPSTANLFFDSNDTATLVSLTRRGYGPGLLNVRSVLFYERHARDKGLRPDYRKRWNATLQMRLAPLIANGTAFGVFLGDELGWDCVPWASLDAAAALVRATLPPLPADVARALGVAQAVIYYNEAFPVLDNHTMWNATCGPDVALAAAGGGYPYVPRAIDWVSIDYYPNEGTFSGARRIYRERLYPRLAAHQRVLFVPPAYTCSAGSDAAFASGVCCANATRDGANPPCSGDCEAAMVGWARQSYAWARADARFVGLAPWYWRQPGGPPPSRLPRNTPMDPGLRAMPRLRAHDGSIGREIVRGTLRDV